MQRKSFITSAAVAGGLALGLVFGPAVAGNASAQTASPLASAAASASASADASAAASTASPIESLRTLFLDNLAEALGIDRTALDSAITTAASSTADEAVANGTLTPQQADALAARIQSGDWGFGGHGGRGGFGGVRVDGVQDAIVAAAAQTLNLTEDELQTQLRDGQTLAQIAEAQGTTEQAVIDAALAAAEAKLDEAVAAGAVTQEQADAAYAQLQERGANLIFGGRGGPGGFGERDGEAMPATPEASPSASTAADA